MADIWTSQNHMIGNVLEEMKRRQEEAEALSHALRGRNKTLEKHLEDMQQVLMEKKAQLNAMSEKASDLQRAALGHNYKMSRS